MATENTDKREPAPGGADRAPTMKERLMAQRAADAAKAAKAPPVPATKPAAPPRAVAGAPTSERAAELGTAAPSLQTGASAPVAQPISNTAPPAGRPAPKPPATAARPASGATPASPANPSSLAKPTSAAKPASTAAPATKPRPAPRPIESAPRKPKGEVNPELQRELEMLKKRQDRPIVIGGIIAGVLLVGALIGLFLARKKQTDRLEAEQAYETSLDKALEDMRAFVLDKEDQAQKAIEYAKANEGVWKGTRVSGDVTSVVNRANAKIEQKREVRELQDSLANVEGIVRDAANKKSDELAQLRRRLTELDQNREKVSTEFGTRVDTAKLAVDRAYVDRLHDEAKAAAAKGAGEARAALTAYTKVEDEVVALLDRAYNQRNEDNKKFYSDRLKDIIAESDVIVAQLFTPEAVEKTPWMDLLTGEQKNNWVNDGLKGWRIDENSVLSAVGPEVGARALGIMSIGDREKWRDFQIECEYTIVKGGATFWFRLGKRADNSSESVPVSTTGNDALRAGAKYGFTASFIGSHIKFVPTDAEAWSGYDNPTVPWTKLRKGAFGITLPEGSEMKINKLRIRVLR